MKKLFIKTLFIKILSICILFIGLNKLMQAQSWTLDSYTGPYSSSISYATNNIVIYNGGTHIINR